MTRPKSKHESRPSRPRSRKRDPNRDRDHRRDRSRDSRRVYEKLRASKGGERESWELHNITLSRVSGYGFGIAVSGGRDNPHFANGDPSIAISDVLKAGPAEGKLRINDRVISANGISLESVDYATAVQVLRECGNTVNLVIKRRIILPSNVNEPQTVKVTLTKSKKKEDFGIVLGCWVYIKEITNRSLLEKDGTIHEGDIITKINNNSIEGVTLKEAKKLIESSKEKLHLVVRRQPSRIHEIQQPWSARSMNEPSITLNKDLPLPSPPNYMDTPASRMHWTNQNVYVQSPTRGDYRTSSEKLEDKNNLSRNHGNWNSCLPEIPYNHLEHNNHLPINSLNPNTLNDYHSPPRPPLPHVEEIDERRDLYGDHSLQRPSSPPDPRFISFKKDGSVGIRLTGGNEVGIFVTGVQHGTSAFLQGLQSGDKILKVNDIDMRGFTKEEAVNMLLGIQDRVNLIIQHRKEEYENVIGNQKGDSFYIRTHFSHESSGKGELNFRKGEVFHVVDTLYNGNHGQWLVFRLGRNGQEIQRGIIPNFNRARGLALTNQSTSKKESDGESRGSFFRRRARRSKSLCKDNWEDIVLANSLTRFPAYERVVLKQPGFIRPVVLFGPLTDIIKERLLKDYPECYASPQSDNQAEEEQSNLKSPGIIRLSSIRDVIDKGKHAILDITPNAVDRLNYAQFYPIVLFMHAENKHIIKEVRAKWSKSSFKSSRKLYEHATKLEKLWNHIFTATISFTTGDSWYKKLQETIDRQQKQPLWVSEAKPDEDITDDFLFPMASRLSYVSSPESDLDLSADSRSLKIKECSPNINDRRLVKSSSDPSITAAEELADTKNLGPYPSFTLGRNKPPLYPYYIFQRETAIPLQSFLDNPNDMIPAHAKVLPAEEENYKERFSNANNNRNVNLNSRSRTDPYGTLGPNEQITNRLNGHLSDPYKTVPRFSNVQQPPKIDRANKPPVNYNQAQLNASDVNFDQSHDYINTLENFNLRESPHTERSVRYDDAYNKQMYNGDAISCQSAEKTLHHSSVDLTKDKDGKDSSAFNFTNSGLPYQSMTLDRARVNQKTRQETRPPPPPPPPIKSSGFKPRLADGRPVPPPKPSQLHSKQWLTNNNALDIPTRNTSMDSSMIESSLQNAALYHSRSYPTSPSKPPPPPKRKDPSFYKQINEHNNSNTTNFPHISHSYGQENMTVSNNRNYSNVPFSELQRTNSNLGLHPSMKQHSPPFPPPPDFVSRETHSSAFDLYKNSDHSNYIHNGQSNGENQKRYVLESPNATHNVIATAQGIFDSGGGTLVSKETGVMIIIPPNAIREGEEHEIYFKVCQDANMLPPLDADKGETLLSPLVMCGPHGLKFDIPVELRLPHRASITPDSWSFALKSSDTKSGEPAEWQNVALDSNKDGVTSSRVENDYVSVLIDHF